MVYVRMGWLVAILLVVTACAERVKTGSEVDDGPVMRTNIRMARLVDGGAEAMTEETRPEDITGKPEPMYYQMEGPAWENDRVGFRLYFDERNGTDIFGKKTAEMVLDSVGLMGSYHEMADWGMDVLKVGQSLGAGGIALMAGDTVYRLGDAASERFRILREEADESSFVVEYRGWAVGERVVDLDWRFTIRAGEDGYHGSVTARGLTGNENLLTGIVNLHSDTLYTLAEAGRFVAYTYGPQAELGHLLGMAISVDNDRVIDYGALPDEDAPVTTTYFVKLPLRDGEATEYTFLTGWEPGDGRFATRAGFEEALRLASKRK